jgi:intracellular sulfur oxidation DsrE/DsrF family protein
VAAQTQRAAEMMMAVTCFNRIQEGMMAKLTRSILVVALCAAVLSLPHASRPAMAQSKQSTASPPAPGIDKMAHRLILQVNTNEPAVMNLALNNAANAEQHYKSIGEEIQIEIVAFGPGLNMLRADTSPVKERIKSLAETSRSISFAACDNTRANMSRTEQKEITLISQATVVPSGVVRVMELQEKGWSYVRP